MHIKYSTNCLALLNLSCINGLFVLKMVPVSMPDDKETVLYSLGPIIWKLNKMIDLQGYTFPVKMNSLYQDLLERNMSYYRRRMP